MKSKGAVFILQRCHYMCSPYSVYQFIPCRVMRPEHHPVQMPHIGRKERSKLISFCDYIFLSGKCCSKPLGPDDLSNSDQLDKVWAWKLGQTRLICYSFWQPLGKSKVWRGKGEWRWRQGWFFLTCIPVEEGRRICYSILLLLKWLLFAWALMFQKAVSSLNDVGTKLFSWH